jgi:hypothetical protein
MKNLTYIVLSVLLIACSNDEQTIEDSGYELSELGEKPVALVGGQVISRAQLDHALAFYSSNPMVNAEEGRIKLLNDMIEEQVMYNKAIQSGFDQSPEFINNQRKLLAYEYKKYLQKKVAESTKVTDVDLQIYYEKNIEKYTKPAMIRFAIYQQRNDLPASKLSLKQVKEAAAYLKPEQGFGKYALESHHSKTANRSGKLSWVSNNSQIAGIPSELFEEADDLKVGQVSSVINTDAGKFLVRLMAKKEKTITPLVSIKSSLRQQLLTDRKQSLYATFVKQTKQDTKIEIFKQNLGKANDVNTTDDSFGPPGFPVSQ